MLSQEISRQTCHVLLEVQDHPSRPMKSLRKTSTKSDKPLWELWRKDGPWLEDGGSKLVNEKVKCAKTKMCKMQTLELERILKKQLPQTKDLAPLTWKDSFSKELLYADRPLYLSPSKSPSEVDISGAFCHGPRGIDSLQWVSTPITMTIKL